MQKQRAFYSAEISSMQGSPSTKMEMLSELPDLLLKHVRGIPGRSGWPDLPWLAGSISRGMGIFEIGQRFGEINWLTILDSGLA